MSHDLVHMLGRVPLCGRLTETELAEVAAIAEVVDVPSDATVFAEGDRADALYLVVAGRLSVQKGGALPYTLARVGDGAVLGEIAILTDEPRTATVRADAPSRLLKIPAARFQGLVRKDSVAALKIVATVADMLARRLALANEKVVELMDKAEARNRQELKEFADILQRWDL